MKIQFHGVRIGGNLSTMTSIENMPDTINPGLQCWSIKDCNSVPLHSLMPAINLMVVKTFKLHSKRLHCSNTDCYKTNMSVYIPVADNRPLRSAIVSHYGNMGIILYPIELKTTNHFIRSHKTILR